MNKKRPAAVLAQCVECRPGRLGAKDSTPSITSNVSAEIHRSATPEVEAGGTGLHRMYVLSQLEIYLDGLH